MIDINHVFFQYSGAEQENLQDFNLQIERGECVVLTGESGSYSVWHLQTDLLLFQVR